MIKTEICDNLCIRDPRNPNHDEFYKAMIGIDIPPEVGDGYCDCDNCVHERSNLAAEALRLMDQVEKVKEEASIRDREAVDGYVDTDNVFL